MPTYKTAAEAKAAITDLKQRIKLNEKRAFERTQRARAEYEKVKAAQAKLAKLKAKKDERNQDVYVREIRTRTSSIKQWERQADQYRNMLEKREAELEKAEAALKKLK